MTSVISSGVAALMCFPAMSFSQSPSEKTEPQQQQKKTPPLVQGKGEAASQSSPTTTAGKGGTRPSTAKTESAEAAKKRAEELLNRTYQEALGADPETKGEALTRIAQSMRKISKDRALYVFQQAFDSTLEVQTEDAVRRKLTRQFQIVSMVSSLDLEKALQMALRMDRVYPTGDQPRPMMNLRNNALSFVAAQMASKSPDRAFEIVEQQVTEGNFEPGFLAPVATALRKSRPDRSEQLFLEAIHQFEKPGQDLLQVQSFVDLTGRLFDLNRSLSAKALDLIIQAIDGLEKKQQEDTVSFTFTSVNEQGKTSISSIREYAAVQAVAMMRRLDPERAKALEEQYSKYRAQISKNPNGIFPIGNDADPPGDAVGNALAQGEEGGQVQKTVLAGTPSTGDKNPSAGAPASTSDQRVTVVRVGGNSGQAPVDANRIASQLQSQMQTEKAVQIAQNNPQAAMNTITQLESPTDRAKALARVAGVIYKTDPEKGKSLLGDAYTAAEKITDPYDRASLYGYLADGYFNFDRDRAKALLTEAFPLVDKVIEQESNSPSTQPFASRLSPEFRRSNQLIQQLITSLSKLNIDEAISRADQISDKKMKLLTMINIADFILNDGKLDSPGIRIVLN
ncbi:MAG: hypothetical protein LAO21_06950 [Acidobacteriia bacterium]|nr:hypothetical protein [Terriglobia bacterium]